MCGLRGWVGGGGEQERLEKRERKRMNQTKSSQTGLNADYIWMSDMLCEHTFFPTKVLKIIIGEISDLQKV